MGHLARESPEVMRGFNTLHRAATAAGVLDTKTKELLALAIAVASHCEGCIGFQQSPLAFLCGWVDVEAAPELRSRPRP
ncbi:MAG: carboxymuconolactone decarboxylase family protein [Cyanobacteriota bacterium]